MMKIKNIYISSLTSLAVIASSAAFAEEMVTAPSFEGGLTAMIGTFYAVPSAEQDGVAEVTGSETHVESIHAFNADPDYDWGWQASLGYIFEDTANGIELFYRGYNSDSSDSASFVPTDDGSTIVSVDIDDQLNYELNTGDLMISQYMDIGTHMQMRFSGGLSYLEIEQEEHLNTVANFEAGTSPSQTASFQQKSEFTGWGPRLSIDARYDFGEDLAGLGIVGGASAAYFLGENDFTSTLIETDGDVTSFKDEQDNQSVTNLRANLGIDYVYFFDNDETTVGIEIGYLVDFYDDATVNAAAVERSLVGGGGVSGVVVTEAGDITFSGPYVNLKAVF